MKYYDMHEDAYKQLKAKDKISWDGETDPEKLFAHEINQAIEKKLGEFYPLTSGLKAVDLGTGTGTCALNLARKGFAVKGYDLSETAIGMARENAETLKLDAEFEVADITQIKTNEKVDLVVDSSLLHCLVEADDRRDFFKLAFELLKDDGHLFIHTMIEASDMSDMTDRDYLVYEDHILYSTGPERWDMDWKQVQGKKVFAHRWISSEVMLEKEIKDAGFEIVHALTFPQEKCTGTFCGWLKKR